MAGKGGKGFTKGTKKELVLEHSRMNMYVFKYEEGGQVPAVLGGEWTNKTQALVARDAYLRERDAAITSTKAV